MPTTSPTRDQPDTHRGSDVSYAQAYRRRVGVELPVAQAAWRMRRLLEGEGRSLSDENRACAAREREARIVASQVTAEIKGALRTGAASLPSVRPRERRAGATRRRGSRRRTASRAGASGDDPSEPEPHNAFTP